MLMSSGKMLSPRLPRYIRKALGATKQSSSSIPMYSHTFFLSMGVMWREGWSCFEPPMRASASSTVTSYPAFARLIAATIPARPAPTTTFSFVSAINFS